MNSNFSKVLIDASIALGGLVLLLIGIVEIKGAIRKKFKIVKYFGLETGFGLDLIGIIYSILPVASGFILIINALNCYLRKESIENLEMTAIVISGLIMIGFSFPFSRYLIRKYTEWKNLTTYEIGGVFFIILIFVIIWGISSLNNLLEAPLIEPFKGEISKYTNDFPINTEPGYTPGKIITVDMEKSEIDPLFLSLPDNLRPKTPDEVSTIAQISCNSIAVAQYITGINYEYQCELKVIDFVNRDVVYSATFDGKPPSPRYTSDGKSGDIYGDLPTSDMLDYLINLPGK